MQCMYKRTLVDYYFQKIKTIGPSFTVSSCSHSAQIRNLIKLKGTKKLTAQGEWVCFKDSEYILFEILENQTWKSCTSSCWPSQPNCQVVLALYYFSKKKINFDTSSNCRFNSSNVWLKFQIYNNSKEYAYYQCFHVIID